MQRDLYSYACAMAIFLTIGIRHAVISTRVDIDIWYAITSNIVAILAFAGVVVITVKFFEKVGK